MLCSPLSASYRGVRQEVRLVSDVANISRGERLLKLRKNSRGGVRGSKPQQGVDAGSQNGR